MLTKTKRESQNTTRKQGPRQENYTKNKTFFSRGMEICPNENRTLNFIYLKKNNFYHLNKLLFSIKLFFKNEEYNQFIITYANPFIL